MIHNNKVVRSLVVEEISTCTGKGMLVEQADRVEHWVARVPC